MSHKKARSPHSAIRLFFCFVVPIFVCKIPVIGDPPRFDELPSQQPVHPIPFVNTFPWMILCAAWPPYILNRANARPHFGQRISPRVRSSAIRSKTHFTSRPRPPLRYLYSRVLHFAQQIEMVRISLRAMRKSRDGDMVERSIWLERVLDVRA